MVALRLRQGRDRARGYVQFLLRRCHWERLHAD
jgi:hypothetical protein